MGRLLFVTFVSLGFALFAIGVFTRWSPEIASGTSIEQVQSRL